MNVANHALAIRNFHEHSLGSRGKPRARGTIQNVHEKEKHQILISERGESEIRTEDLHTHHRTTKDVQSGMKRKERFARQSIQTPQGGLQDKKDTTVMSTERTSSQVPSIQRRRVSRPA